MKKMTAIKRKTKQRLAGFTLAEVGIVLAVAAIVLGGIWVAGEGAWQNNRLYVGGQQILLTVQNIRGSYTGASQLPGAAGTDLTKTFDADNLFPVEMRRCPKVGTCHTPGFTGGPGKEPIDSPFNNSDATGSFHVYNIAQPLKPPYFRIQLLDVDEGSCIKLLMQEPVEDVTLGMIGVGTNLGVATAGSTQSSASINYQGLGTNINGNVSFPFNSVTAGAWCIVGNGGAPFDEMDFDFKLH